MARLALAGALVALMGSGCMFSRLRSPLDTNFEQTQLGAKEGRASAYSVLWLVAWGDCGAKAAATNGGLQTIRHADRETVVLLFGLYSRMTTVVYGD